MRPKIPVNRNTTWEYWFIFRKIIKLSLFSIFASFYFVLLLTNIPIYRYQHILSNFIFYYVWQFLILPINFLFILRRLLPLHLLLQVSRILVYRNLYLINFVRLGFIFILSMFFFLWDICPEFLVEGSFSSA